MTCEFCDEGSNCGVCIPLGKGSVSFGIDYEDFDKPMFYFELSTPSAKTVRRLAHFEVEICPVCGRKLVER